jgi:hypothetical protein
MGVLTRPGHHACNNKLLTAGIAAALILLGACGGSGGSGGGNPPPGTPDFQLNLKPRSISVPAGGSAQTDLTAVPLNGFSSPVSVQINGLPAGVTALPDNPTLTPGVPQTITLSAASNSSATAVTSVITGMGGGLSHQANLGVSVTTGGNGDPSSTRTRYVRTDAVTEYFLSLNDHWILFHSATSRFFVTDPFGNQISVLDAASQKQIATIAVPGAWGLDDTPDHSMLFVGTLLGDVYVIDPVAMKVKRRYLASEIGPYGFAALSALVLADGRLALLGEQGGIPSVDGSTAIAFWDPTTNAITIYGSVNAINSGVIPTQPLCPMGNIGGFSRTADRTSVLLGSIDSDGTVCQITESTGQKQSFAATGSPAHIAVSPDGNYLAFQGVNQSVTLYNAHTLTPTLNFPVSQNVSANEGMLFSPDSTRLYITGSQFVYAYGIPAGQLIGWLPNIVVEPISGGLEITLATAPAIGAFDSTGLLAGPMEEGVGFLDTTQFRTGAVGTQFTNGYLNPDTGPTEGGTAVQLPDPNAFGALSAMYFGSKAATNVMGSSGLISANTPPGNPGPADVYVFTSDGGMQILPEGFSYGPTILEVTPNYSTAEGGGTGVIYGYGFGPLDGTTIPAGLSVSVGGQPATLTGYNGDVYGIISQPFPLESIFYTIPPGSPASAANVAVTTSAGTASAPGAMAYLPATQQFPLAGAQLAQGIYDPHRDLYYFTDASRVQVFSRTQGKWLSPINIPAPAGAKQQRLWGLALSPNGSELAIADINADVIYVLNPASPAAIQTFAMTTGLPQGIVANPAGIAITDAGIAFLTVEVLGGTGFSGFFKLDTHTGVLTNLNLDGPGLGTSDSYLRTVLSADNSRAFFNDFGAVFTIDTSTGIITQTLTGQGCCNGNYDLALAANQIQFAATGFLYDADLNGESFITLNDREGASISYVYGNKLSPDGSLLFQPSTNGIDIFDGRVGLFRDRVALPFALSPNYDALVEDGKDNVVVAITGANGDGIAVLDFSSIPEPPPLPYPNASLSLSKVHYQLSTRARSAQKMSASGPRTIPHVTVTQLSRPH